METNEVNDLVNLIRQRSREIAPDYPNINTDLKPSEHLWAISETCEGVKLANDDCHEFIAFLLNNLGWSQMEGITRFSHTKDTNESSTSR